MKILTFLTVIIVVLAFSGCGQKIGVQRYLNNQVKQLTDAAKAPEVAPKVKDVKLAEIILRKKAHKLSITSDPFEPLLKDKSMAAPHIAGKPNKEAFGEDPLLGIQYIGMIKVMDEASALVKTTKGKDIFKLNDQVNKMTLIEINNDFLVFTKEAKNYKLKRGVL